MQPKPQIVHECHFRAQDEEDVRARGSNSGHKFVAVCAPAAQEEGFQRAQAVRARPLPSFAGGQTEQSVSVED